MIDTKLARDRILGRIRQAQKHAPEATSTERAAIEGYLSAHPRGPQQHLVQDLVGQFIEQAERMSSSVERLSSSAEVAQAVRRYLDQHKVEPVVVVSEELEQLDWHHAGISSACRVIEDADLTAVTATFAAIADTGTLCFLSSRATPASNNLLPENHIVVLRESQLLPAMEDVFDRIRNERGELPRAVNFVSGPSRTGDIEQTIVLGAHGPYRVHVLLVAS
jgi:L-lactate dehydrogenase complex protein LldG